MTERIHRADRTSVSRLLSLAALTIIVVAVATADDKKTQALTTEKTAQLKTVTFLNVPTDDRWPTWDVGCVGFRNPRKTRPLYLAGGGYEGTMTVHFEDISAFEEFIGEEAIGKLASAAKTTGKLSAVCEEYSVGGAGYERFACTEWIESDPRPVVVVEITDIRSWVPLTRKAIIKSGTKAKYSAVADGQLKLVRRVWKGFGVDRKPVDTVLKTARFQGGKAEVEFMEVGVFKEVPVGGMLVRGTATIKGEDLGLAGNDAGEMEVYFSVMGMTDYGEASSRPIDPERVDVD